MLKSRFIEDVFIEFINYTDSHGISLDKQDITPSISFYNVIIGNNQLTKNQANYIIKILQKYKNLVKLAGFDYSPMLVAPEWRQEFRTLDMTKKIFVEQDQDGQLWICLKFPFALKEEFEREIKPVNKDMSSSIWDPERKIRKLKLYNYNLIQVHDFSERNNLDIDDSFLLTLGSVEEIWQNSEKIAPFCRIADNQVVLENANSDATEYFLKNRTGSLDDDLLLAKSMGYFLAKKPENLVEKIVSSTETRFHIKTVEDFLSLYKNISGTVAVVVDKSNTTETWVKDFCKKSENFGISKEKIRVCFRLDKNEDRGFNAWIKDSGYGGKVDGADILIFQGKPAKWLFSNNISVKIIVTNSLFPPMSGISQSWFDAHSCVCYVGDIKAAHVKEKKIVEL